MNQSRDCICLNLDQFLLYHLLPLLAKVEETESPMKKTSLSISQIKDRML